MKFQLLSLLLSSLTVGTCLAQLASCPNEVPAECPVNSTVSGCSTCCCASSDNVEFYVPSVGEPTCTAPAAVYEIRFVATWTAACHPDYYFGSAHWSPLTGISHKPEYELWDACMYDVSQGVAVVSQTGSTFYIKQEYSANAAYVLDSFSTLSLFPGAGTLSAQLNFDSDHQYVSMVTMLAPSADRMMGVSSVRLCNGSEWKESVKLCGELFSTATKSNRVSDERNTIQYNNCSFGYFSFSLVSVEEPAPSTTAAPSTMVETSTIAAASTIAAPSTTAALSITAPPSTTAAPFFTAPPSTVAAAPSTTTVIPDSTPIVRPETPDSNMCGGTIPECATSPPASVTAENCPSCCCSSSSNVEFYQSREGEPSCTAPSAVYEVKLVATWTQSCHPDYYFSGAHWSPFTGISHTPEYELWDACMYDVSDGVARVSQTGSTDTINEEYDANSAFVLDTFTGNTIPGQGTITAELDFDCAHQYVSVVSMLAPSVDQMIGVSLVRLCNGSEWKQSVKLCAELFSTATKSSRVSDGRNSIQYNNCSFGYFEFTLLRTEEINITMCSAALQANSAHHLTGSFVHFVLCQMLLVLILKLISY